MASWAEGAPPGPVLDIATGAGHTARRLAETGRKVLGTDITPEMIAVACSVPSRGVLWAVAEASNQPVRARSIAVVSCRIAPHHFPGLSGFLAESRRVLSFGGLLVVTDNIADPATDAWLNRVERLRDPSHVRSYTLSEWRQALDTAGFHVLETLTIERHKSFADWLGRTDPSQETVALVEQAFVEAPTDVKDLHHVSFGPEGVQSWVDEKVLLAATPG